MHSHPNNELAQNMRLATVTVVLNLPLEVEYSFDKKLEVSLDCSYCKRVLRTVDFTLGESYARCHPGSAKRLDEEHPPYPGRLVDLSHYRNSDNSVMAEYSLEYEVSPFHDTKYNVLPMGYPTWARVAYDLYCPQCKAITKAFAENENCPPLSVTCDCGYELYVETQKMPLLIRWFEPISRQWKQVCRETKFTRKEVRREDEGFTTPANQSEIKLIRLIKSRPTNQE